MDVTCKTIYRNAWHALASTK